MPMVMKTLPPDRMPKESRRLKLVRMVSGLFRLSPEDLLRQRFHETMRLVQALLAKRSGMAPPSGASRAKG